MLHGTIHPDFAAVADTFQALLPPPGRDGRAAGGASVAVMHRGELVVDLWGGTRDEHGAPFQGDTLALSFSTTKGITSTLAHILASQGKLDYDARVAHYWPEFGANGKDAITVRHLMRHQAGLYSIRALVDDATDMLDFDGMLRRLERATPLHSPGVRTGYHALTYGWLVGGLIEKITGRRFADVLRDELATPLGLRGCYVGLPESELHRRAHLVGIKPKRREAARTDATGSEDAHPRARNRNDAASRLAPARLRAAVVRTASSLAGLDPSGFNEALFPKGGSRFDWNAEATVRACIPAAGGMFDARSLARVYGMLANQGELEGVRVLDPAIVARASRLEDKRRDVILPMPMHWRLGYHRVLSLGGSAPQGFGHFGFGGSGAFCDPSRALSVGFVLNHGVGTPFGDTRIWRLNGAILRAVDKRKR